MNSLQNGSFPCLKSFGNKFRRMEATIELGMMEKSTILKRDLDELNLSV